MVARLNSGVPKAEERVSMCLLKRGFQVLGGGLGLVADILNHVLYRYYIQLSVSRSAAVCTN